MGWEHLTWLTKLVPEPTRRVLERGLFCFSLLDFLVGLARILRWATKTTCLPLNFFSNSRTSLNAKQWSVKKTIKICLVMINDNWIHDFLKMKTEKFKCAVGTGNACLKTNYHSRTKQSRPKAARLDDSNRNKSIDKAYVAIFDFHIQSTTSTVTNKFFMCSRKLIFNFFTRKLIVPK